MLGLAGSATDRRSEPRSDAPMAPWQCGADQSDGVWADGLQKAGVDHAMEPLALYDRMSQMGWQADWQVLMDGFAITDIIFGFLASFRINW